MKVAVAYPPIISPKGVPLLSQNRQFQWFSRPTFIYPVIPAYAATMARQDGHEVVWMDGIAERWTEERFLATAVREAPDVMLLETKTPVVRATWRWVARLKERLPAMRVALAGDHVTALPAESMARCPADFILAGGDFDFLLLNLLRHLRQGTPLEPGIWRRDASGAVVDGGPFATSHDLDTLPHIDRELTRWRLYSVHNGNYRRTPGTYIMAGRDCWHGRCTFCSWTTLFPTYRVRSPEKVADEVGELIEHHGVREIMDDTGCFPRGEWLREFCRLMIERGYNRRVHFDCNMRFGALGPEDYALMRKAGFRFVLFGLESACQETLDRLRKNLKAEQIAEGARAAAEAGLEVHVTVMLGFPWEGAAEIARTVALARELLIRGWAGTLQVTLAIPYPGTPLFRECREQGLLTTENWDDFDMRTCVMRTPVGEEEIKAAIRRIYRAFFHPRALWHRLRNTRHPWDDARFYCRGLRSLRGHLRDFGS
jgi:anaerobic magnesium-protoporphyrin IX monomethyl ester cyclase